MRKEVPREERVRREILDATQTLVERLGFAKVTLEDIAGELGKKKSFLYYYYEDKEAILSAMTNREMERILEAIREEVERWPTGKDKLLAFLRQSHSEIHKRLPFILHLRREIRANDHGAMAMLFGPSREFLRLCLPLLRGLLRDGVRDGSLRRLSDLEIEALAQFTIMTLRGVEYEYVVGEPDKRIEEHFATALTVLERGLTS